MEYPTKVGILYSQKLVLLLKFECVQTWDSSQCQYQLLSLTFGIPYPDHWMQSRFLDGMKWSLVKYSNITYKFF